MTYSKANRMATATVSGTTSTYTYDAFGTARQSKPAQPHPDHAVRSGRQSADGNEHQRHRDGLCLHGWHPGGSDPAGSGDDLRPPDRPSGNAANRHRRIEGDRLDRHSTIPTARSRPTGSITQNLRFPGQQADQTGYYYNINRTYIPAYGIGGGRYGQVDPLGLAAGANPFLYADSNPLKYIDPLGLAPGDLPSPPPGYDPNKWHNGTDPDRGQPTLKTPDGSKIYTAHPEELHALAALGYNRSQRRKIRPVSKKFCKALAEPEESTLRQSIGYRS